MFILVEVYKTFASTTYCILDRGFGNLQQAISMDVILKGSKKLIFQLTNITKLELYV